jgi:CheY-like chemotaxis protein
VEGHGIRLSIPASTHPDYEQPSSAILLIGSGVAMAHALISGNSVQSLASALHAKGVTKIVALSKQRDFDHAFEVLDNIAHCKIALIVDAYSSMDSSESLLMAQSLRRDHRLRIPLIFWTVSTPISTGLSAPDVPGSYHLPFPSRLCDLAELIRAAQPVPDEATMREIIRHYCRFEERRSVLLHDLLNAIGARKLSESRELSRQLATLIEGDDQEAQDAIDQAETLIAALQVDTGLESAISYPPPSHWRSLLIVDDDGYSPVTVAALKAKGYAPRAVIETFDEAVEEVEDDPPDVLLCDYRLEGDPTQGVELARRALACEDVKLVILISAEPIPKSDVPPGAVALGGLEKFDAERIHALIIEAAQKQ